MFENETLLFQDRKQAGQKLAKHIKKSAGKNSILLALPRGGVPVGYQIAKALSIPLDTIIVRKIGAPGHKEFGVGAIAEGDVKVLDWSSLTTVGLSEADLKETITNEQSELKRRIKLYRNNKPLPNLKNKTVILVDDGLATGVTAKAAIASIKKHHPKQIIIAAPVCAYDTAKEMGSLVDEVICLICPFNIGSIGIWYQNFEQVSDEQVVELIKKSVKNLSNNKSRSNPFNEKGPLIYM